MKVIMYLLLILLSNIGQAAEPVKVAVIDTGLSLVDLRFKDRLCKSGHRDFTGTGINDVNGHGTHITGLIISHAQNANYCLLILKYYADGAAGIINTQRFVMALKHAAAEGAKIINLSVSGVEVSKDEKEFIRANSKILFIVSAGNDGKDLTKNPTYPAAYGFSNILVVGALKHDGNKLESSNWGALVDKYELGENLLSTVPYALNMTGLGYLSGTSQATAVVTGKFLKSKY